MNGYNGTNGSMEYYFNMLPVCNGTFADADLYATNGNITNIVNILKGLGDEYS